MTVKLYEIFLDNKKIGTTELENSDAPMGVVYGRVTFDHIDSGYDFLKTYCVNNNIVIITDYTEDKVTRTVDIPNLKISNLNWIEIKGQVTNIEGMESEVFEIIICGISYPFFEEEFPHHVKTYNDQFKLINQSPLQ